MYLKSNKKRKVLGWSGSLPVTTKIRHRLLLLLSVNDNFTISNQFHHYRSSQAMLTHTSMDMAIARITFLTKRGNCIL